jgi:hypothetical protein
MFSCIRCNYNWQRFTFTDTTEDQVVPEANAGDYYNNFDNSTIYYYDEELPLIYDEELPQLDWEDIVIFLRLEEPPPGGPALYPAEWL